MYAIYILQCADGSYYTGLSNDLERRLWQHETGFFPDCYTFKRRPVKLVWQTRVETVEEADKMEKQIKGWSRKKKEALISGDIDELKRLSNEKKEGSLKTLRQAQGHIDYLIVGQGICGTFLSYYLQKENKSFLVIDNKNENAPSRIAAGIINPVTGRRMVTTWMIDELMPFAWEAYSALGHDLNITAISHKNIIDFFATPQMREAFLKKIEEDDRYVHTYPEQNHFNAFFNYDFGCGEIRPAYMTHLEAILPEWRKVLSGNQQLLEEEFNIDNLNVTKTAIQYGDIHADKIIFCDGVSCFTNPYFKLLPFAPNKGETIIAEIPGLPEHNIYKKGFLIAPLSEPDLFWIGSSYEWDFTDVLPSQKFRNAVKDFLKNSFKIPATIIDHKAGERPATLERRPFVGMHPLHDNIGILNGMGTKGCSLAPYFAKQLTDLLVYNTPIQPDADVRRFHKILARS